MSSPGRLSARQRRQLGRRTTCASLACFDPPSEGRRFCTGHAEQLDRVRDQLAAEGATRGRSALGHLKKDKRIIKGPVCCTVGCFEPRASGDTFCSLCVASGAVED